MGADDQLTRISCSVPAKLIGRMMEVLTEMFNRADVSVHGRLGGVAASQFFQHQLP